MYEKELRKRGDINSAINHVFSGKYPHRYTNNSLNYFENLQKELDARKSKSARMLYRRELKHHQDKLNYTNEIQRLRGELSKNDTRLPIGTRKTLEDRIAKLKELGGQIVDEIK
jgi:hypothetical protein